VNKVVKGRYDRITETVSQTTSTFTQTGPLNSVVATVCEPRKIRWRGGGVLLNYRYGTSHIVSAIFPSLSAKQCQPTRRKAGWISPNCWH